MDGTALRGRAPALERREAGSETPLVEVKKLIEGVNRGFEEFKTANDRRLKELEQRGAADPTATETVNKLEGQIKKLSDELMDIGKKANRIPAGGSEPGAMDTPEKREHRAGWDKWARRGAITDHELRDLERKANTTLVPEDGGLLVPETVDGQILKLLRDESEVRGLFDAQAIGTTEYRKLVSLGGAGSGWVGETEARPATSGPQWTEIAGTFGEIYANPQVSQTLLDDSRVDLEAELAGEIAYEFAQKEGRAFLFGDGVKKPKGLFTAPMAATGDKTRPFGTFQFLPTGAAATLPTTAPGDLLLDVIYSLKKGYRRNARWLMNGVSLATMRKWKDNDGNYLWQPSLQAGEPGSLLGYPVTDLEDMPDVAANAMPIAFGDFRRAYRILDRIGIRTLRDPYTNKPFVGFYTTKRVGGMILDTQAVKFVKVAA
ncbi:phage major capsid protein [Roseomonas ludipueritiae]|uniref:Phage major capsid protein n=2 Tax=Pseudoroseomonas ludipueritiae TaxID=198093 RepID=A0ABR7R4V9_9PROT|nr:phage major capsid protein [Pseudoroseomonas ludipueritiae]